MNTIKLHRRGVFQALIALSAVGGLSACGADSGGPDAEDAPVPGTGGAFDAADMALITALSETLIPETETAGAVAAGIPETLQSLATDWGDADYQTYWRDGLASLRTSLDARAGDSFDTLDLEQRAATLVGYDADVFDGQIDDGFYRDFKNTAIQAYYMSEPGATEALAYEPVPGEWIGCVPLSDFPKNWAT